MYILCRPLNGLNDLLCQIVKCALKAKATNRALIIDISCSGCSYPVDIERYFMPQTPEVHGLKDLLFALPAGYEAMTVFPPHLQGRLQSYTVETRNGDWVETNTGESVSLNSTPADAYEKYDIIVHHTATGGDYGIYALRSLLRPTPFTRDLIYGAIASLLDGQYMAFHVRNTDHTVLNLSVIIDKVIHRAQQKQLPVLVCSDNVDTETEVCEKLRNSGIETITLPRAENYSMIRPGTPLHGPSVPHEIKDQVFQDTLITLCALGATSSLLVAPCKSSLPNKVVISGFARLAVLLHRLGVRRWLEV
jgi:hypothetical protein